MTETDPIPVQLMTGETKLVAVDARTALLRLPANSGHGHGDGENCPACAARSDVRALLFDLLESAKQGLIPEFTRVVVDASDVTDSGRVVAALTGKLPAQALRDHIVARRFYLAGQA